MQKLEMNTVKQGAINDRVVLRFVEAISFSILWPLTSRMVFELNSQCLIICCNSYDYKD